MTKPDLKNATGVDTSKFAKKVDLASLKSETDKLGVGKLETTANALSTLSDVVKNKFVKNTVYDELVKSFNAIQTTDTSNLVKTVDYNKKLLRNLIMIMVIKLLNKNLICWQQIILQRD